MENKQVGSETLLGHYHTMPDGQIYQQMSDGRWVNTEDRIKEAEKSITERFKDTATVPADWVEPEESSLKLKKSRNIEDLIKVSSTHRHLHAHLIEVLGCPTDIIKNKKLNETVYKRTVNDYHIKRSVEKIITALDVEPWNTVLKIINHDPIK